MNLTYGILHLFCGSGGAALGFKDAQAEWRGIRGDFITLGGIDSDPEACADFEKLTGVPATRLDLFSREDYIAYHGAEPPADWKEALPADIRATCNVAPDVIFLSAPCKGFSGLLPRAAAKSEKYQALNRLTVRGLFLALEAFKDDLPGIILFENVPRITTRGADLLQTIKGLLTSYGYAVQDGFHDCGELGGLGQRRRRYLLIARNPEKIPAFVYKPPKKELKTIGDIIGPMSLPDDPGAGPMHRLPRLQWRTWVRLALIPAGGDWRDLEKMAPGTFGLEYVPRGGGPYGVQKWDEPGATVTGHAGVRGSNAAAIADPRLSERDSRHPAVYKVIRFDQTAPCITGTRFGSGAPAVADPRLQDQEGRYSGKFGVTPWDNPAPCVTGIPDIQAGAPSVADPRKPHFNHIYRVTAWDETAGAVTGAGKPSSGAVTVADPRLSCNPRNGLYGVQDWSEPGNTVTGARNLHSGTAAVADPRIPADNERPDPPPVIIALDGTWHRPLTTLELAALQGFPLTINGEPLKLAGESHARWRERIGNAVPVQAAEAIGKVILGALLRSSQGWWLCDQGMDAEVWVRRTREA